MGEKEIKRKQKQNQNQERAKMRNVDKKGIMKLMAFHNQHGKKGRKTGNFIWITDCLNYEPADVSVGIYYAEFTCSSNIGQIHILSNGCVYDPTKKWIGCVKMSDTEFETLAALTKEKN